MLSKKINQVFIGSDHAGLEMKQQIIQYLQQKSINFVDKGTYTSKSCDYPDFAELVCQSVLKEAQNIGILICGSGVGISIAANKIKGIRCALCHDQTTAYLSRSQNHCNIVAFGARVIGIEIAKQIVETYLTVDPLDDILYQKKIQQIEEMEQKFLP